MQKYYSIFLLFFTWTVVSAQQIDEIVDYTPAPGQFINTASGSPDAALSLTTENGGLVSLGGFGGYIILKSSGSIENDPDNPFGVDFTIFGNAMPHWSEPGIVAVMKDENENGLPDETWYELAGSDHFFSSTISDYQISYSNPNSDKATDIHWGDNQGASGQLLKNNFQHQPYYPNPQTFAGIGESKCEFEGTRITPVLDFSNPAQYVSLRRRFGYADNNHQLDSKNPIPDDPYAEGIQNSGGDGMDISWAIDETGSYVDLDEIDFIKIYSGVNANGGHLGELSTEICNVVDVAASSGFPIADKVVTVKELPSKIAPDSYKLEYSVFFNGRYKAEETVRWSVECFECTIQNNEILQASAEEILKLTATLDSDPDISTSFSTQAEKGVSVSLKNEDVISIYPNPACDYIILNLDQSGTYQLISSQGQVILEGESGLGENRIDLSRYQAGIYFIRVQNVDGPFTYKVMIQK